MYKQPYISIIIPIHDMQNGAEFLWSSINRLCEQSFQDFEIIITKEGKMAENTNAGIKRAKGKLVKILYLDDCLASPHSLQKIVDEFTDDVDWLITGVDTNPEPYWTDDITTGNNKLGSPSALTFRNRREDNQLFDENMSWLLDVDLYMRLFNLFGLPKIVPVVNVIMGIGEHQVTNLMSNEDKLAEYQYLKQKYE